MDAVNRTAGRLGYAFHTGPEAIIPAKLRAVPSVWLLPPKLVSEEGRRECRTTYLLNLYFIGVPTPTSKNDPESAFCVLERDAIELFRNLEDNSAITRTSGLKSSPLKSALTKNGEPAVAVEIICGIILLQIKLNTMGIEIVDIPAQYSSVFRNLIYAYQGIGTGKVVDIEICGGTPVETLGVKRIADTGIVRVNVSGYLKRQLSPRPVKPMGSGFYTDGGRIIVCMVKNGDNVTFPRIFTAALKNLSPGDLLTLMPLHRNIGRSEKDEVSFVTEGGPCSASFEVKGAGTVSFAADDYMAGAGICTFVTDMEWVMSKVREKGGNPSLCRAVHVRISSGGGELAHMIYILKDTPKRSIRVCWLNSLGGIDYFTFNVVVSQQIRSVKERIISGETYMTVASAAETHMELNSGYLPEALLESLSEIVASSRVWVCRDGGFVPLDVVSTEAVRAAEELACLRIKVRESDIVKFQTF